MRDQNTLTDLMKLQITSEKNIAEKLRTLEKRVDSIAPKAPNT